MLWIPWKNTNTDGDFIPSLVNLYKIFTGFMVHFPLSCAFWLQFFLLSFSYEYPQKTPLLSSSAVPKAGHNIPIRGITTQNTFTEQPKVNNICMSFKYFSVTMGLLNPVQSTINKRKKERNWLETIPWDVKSISFKRPIVSAQWLKMEASSKNCGLIPAKSVSQIHKPVQNVFNKYYH